MVGGQRHAEALALGAHDLVGETRVRVGALEHRGDAEPARRAQRLARALRPGVDDVDPVRQPRQRAGDDPVVQLQRALAAERPVGDPDLAARQRRADADVLGQRPVHGARHHQHVGARLGGAGGLVPGGRADPRRADLVREALQDADGP